jgi:hypothetical protein
MQALKDHELLAKAEAAAMREEVERLTDMLTEAKEKLKVCSTAIHDCARVVS